MAVATDALGQAAAPWTLGTRAGAGNNLVEAMAVGFSGSALFAASALPAAPDKINADAGNNQTGAAAQPLALPFVAVVTDAGHNRLAGVAVTFSVVQGAGSFNGLANLTVDTDASGRAVALLTLGPEEGFDNNVVEADFAGLVGLPATFVATGKVPGDPAATRVSGVVLDNSDIPVPGVTLSIEGTALSAQSDAQGQFTIANLAPGPLTLLADGATATRPGTWPALAFELVAVAGQDNRLVRPIYLLPLDTANEFCVDAAAGGTLTLPEVPGFALTVEPGAATFPGGGTAGCISVTPVHADKVPMTPNFGQQPRFVVTIQPAGVVFDPPAPLSLPNTDGLAPGAVTELYAFDHDLGQFVSIGTGTVSADGTTVASDPGVGIVKSGWAGAGDPDDTGDAENVGVSFSPPPAIFLSSGPVTISASGGPSPGSFSWSSSNSSVLSLGSSSSASVTATPVAPGTAQVSVIYTAQSGKSSLPATATVTVVSVDSLTADGATEVPPDPSGDQEIIHFVTPKETGQVTLTAAISPDTPEIRQLVTWEGAIQDSADPLKATVSKAASAKHVVGLKVDGKVGKEVRVWVVSATGVAANTSPIIHRPTIVRTGDGIAGPGLASEVSYAFTFSIKPNSIITEVDRPNLSGDNSVLVPGFLEKHIVTRDSLQRGANKKWDVSRQIRIKVFNPNLFTKDQLDRVFGAVWDNQPVAVDIPASYPLDEVKGTDDTSVIDEDNDPYSEPDISNLTSFDIPLNLMKHSIGIAGDTFEFRVQFREFVRLEIGTQWQRISDFLPWRVHFKIKKLYTTIHTGLNGISETTAVGDDVQIIPFGDGSPNRIAIKAGLNFVIDTVPQGDDFVLVDTIVTGANGIAETTAVGDDVQLIAVGQGELNREAVASGPNGVIDSTTDGDDEGTDSVWVDDGSTTAADNAGF